jgi:uncharacterized repeat protein (TIGR01451 family)
VAGIVSVGLALGSIVTGCGSTRLGGLEVATVVASTGSTASTPSVPQGTDVDVEITISNVSQNSISGVTVRVAVPAGFTYLGTVTTAVNGNSERSADIAPTTKDATLTWGAWTAELAATGAPATAQFSPEVFATGFVNTLSGTPLSLTISPAPSLNVQLRVSPAAVAAGERVTYQVVVTNTGSGEAPNTSVGITLPDEFDYASSSGTSGNASLGGASFPTVGTEVPIWSGIDVPGAGSAGPGILSMSFTVEVLPTVPHGIYTCSASLVASTGSQTQDFIQHNYTALAPVQVTGA